MIISSFNIPYHTQQAFPANNTASISTETVHSLSLYILKSCGSSDAPVQTLAAIPISVTWFKTVILYGYILIPIPDYAN